MKKTITVTLRKKTIKAAYNELKLLKIIGAAYAQKNSPMQTLLIEIKRSSKRKTLWEKIKEYFI